MLNCVSEGGLLNHPLSEAMHAAHSAVDPREDIGQVRFRSCASRTFPATLLRDSGPPGGPRTHVPEAVRSPGPAAAEFRVTDSAQTGLTPEPGLRVPARASAPHIRLPPTQAGSPQPSPLKAGDRTRGQGSQGHRREA